MWIERDSGLEERVSILKEYCEIKLFLSHQIDGNDEIVLLPLSLLLVFAGLHGGRLGCHFHLAFLS